MADAADELARLVGFGPALPASEDPNLGRRIGPYRLVRRVGEGGMGSVYAAERADQEFQKQVAVKLLRAGSVSENSLRRFRVERQTLASLDHPNIARLIDGGTTDDGLPYLVMEFVEGEQIDRYSTIRQLSIADRLKLFREACAAVQYAHQNLIVHRDLKPNNILVTTDGTVKLLDFGIAKLLQPQGGEDVAVTSAEQGPMTLENASPEQIRGEPITTSTDVYALGVLLYILLTGRHPFREKSTSIIALQQAILMDTPEKPSAAVLKAAEGFVKDEAVDKTARRVRGDLDTIVLTALRKEPQRRYASVERFSDDIDRHLKGLPVGARKDTLGYRAGKFVRRHAAGVAATGIAAMALLVSSAMAIRSGQKAERRFNEVRQLAHFVLFDLDNAIRAGTTPARKTVLEEALKYLSNLERDSNGDPSLDLEVAAAYMKVGDLQGNLYLANVGDERAARRSYEKAYRVASAVASAHPRNIEAQRDAAAASVDIANVLLFGPDRDEAVRRYNEAQRVFETLAPQYPPAEHDLMDVWSKIGLARLQVGDPNGALAAYGHCLKIAESLAGSDNSFAAQRAVAYGQERVGYATARSGNVDEGLARLRDALGSYERLANDAPDKAAAQRDVESTNAMIGDILLTAGKAAAAVESYRKALAVSESLAASDPNNGQFKRDRIVMLSRLSDAESKAGKTAESRALAEKTIGLLKPVVEGAGASDPDVIQYCVLMLSLNDRGKAAEALPYALKLVEHTQGKDAVTLEVLARAWNMSGDRTRAIETAEKALAILRGTRSSEMTTELEKDLADFRAGAPQSKR